MKTLSVTDVARNFSSVIDDLEEQQQEIVLTRNHRAVARLVPEPAAENAIEVLGDLYRTLDEETADSLSAAIEKSRTHPKGSLEELRDPWAS